jgi:hypothetical protein
MPETSKFLTLDKTDLQKLGKSLLLTIVAAAGVAVASWFDALPTVEDWGAFAPVVGAFAPFVANVIRKLLSTSRVTS